MTMQKNRGFTLIELLVTVAILSIVLAGVTSLMVTGSRSFTKGNADADVQKEAELAVNQIEDMIIDANSGVDYIESTGSRELVLYNQTDGIAAPVYTKESVKWDKTNQNIVYSKWNMVYDASAKTFVEDSVLANQELMAEGVSDFNVDISDTRDEYNADGQQIKIVQSVQITAEYTGANGRVSYATTPVITLRNRMMLAGNTKMVYEEPPRPDPTPKILNVDVSFLSARQNVSYQLEAKFIANVMADGYEDGEVSYQWTADKSWVHFLNGNSNPEECTVTIDYMDWFSVHTGETFTVTLTATGSDGTSAQDSDSYTIYRNNDTAHERGAYNSVAYFDINNTINGDAESYELYIEKRNGDLYENQEELKQYISISLDNGGFGFTTKVGLDPTKEYFVRVVIHTKQSNIVERVIYIPAVTIVGLPATCPWKGFGNITYGDYYCGDGIRYTMQGYMQEAWYQQNVSSVELVEQECLIENMPEGAKLVLTPVQCTTLDATSNKFRQTFQLDVTGCTQAEKDAIVVRSIKVRIYMKEEGYQNVQGFATVIFTD